MTPGAYLRKRREAAGVPIDAVVGLSASIEQIEADQVDITIRDAIRLGHEFDFDRRVLDEIIGEIEVQLCRVCACSEWDPCVPDSCYWVEPDLCSSCEAVE